ncbi:ankyrin repeat domain-containing protein [Aspergillus homomorphus CBS 101889]|uniref:Ankyrin n=1 Tax=Aspergillus homomorphus (strain CBS 101889) TaxID=1450537 RepID=A0A395HYT6_ASPHC|nr:ankyrin [Aspergillus homomorphus CBS 101889]RAL12679.1 ankyrin [Aspergillus homomorphus CBS 101889]
MVGFLLARGADVNAAAGRYGNALHLAVRGGHIVVVESLLDSGADVDAKGGLCGNALCAAAWRRNLKMAPLLISRKARLDIVDRLLDGTPYLGLLENDIEVIGRLETDPHIRETLGKVFGEQFQDDAAVIEMVLANSFEADALQIATRRGCAEIVELLIQSGADVNRQAGQLENALQVAARRRQVEVAQILLAQGADVNGDVGTLVMRYRLRVGRDALKW